MADISLALNLEGSYPVLQRLAHRVHMARAAHATLDTLDVFDTIERQDSMARSTTKHTIGICAGVCVAVFPFAPVMVKDCHPISEASWICGARMSAFIAACGELFVGAHCAWTLYRGRGYCDQQAARLALGLAQSLPDGDRCGLAADVLRTYRAASPANRDRLRSLLAQSAWNA